MLTFVDSDGKDCTVESYKGTLYSTCLQSSFKPELVVENAQMMIELNKLTARVTDLESSLTARVTDLEKLTTEHTTDIAENTDAHIQNAADNIAANTDAHGANAENIGTNTDAHEPVDSCDDLRMRGITTSGVYPLNTANGIVNTKCLYQNSRMWTLVYKIGLGSGMKTTGSENLAALVTNSNTDDSGKLSDSDIKRLCAGQYCMKQPCAGQHGSQDVTEGHLYCKFDDINTYATNEIVNKLCAQSFSTNGVAYTGNNDGRSIGTGYKEDRALNFGGWGHEGAIITQLSYRGDARFGPSGCETEVYCI
jgi:hypothetical protein